MRVFLTGATGFVGFAVVQQLLQAGHELLGLARSDAGAKKLADAGAQVHRGDLQDLDSLRSGAASAEAVIHTGFIHDFANFKAVCEIDRHAIDTLAEQLAGSERPLIVTSGTALLTQGRPATEEDIRVPIPSFPRASEEAAADAVKKGVRAMVVRLSPSVHGDGDHGFVPILINTAREKGVSAYVGDGLNRWTGVHRFDAALLYRLCLEKGSAGAIYHGVADQVAFRDIAEVIGKRLNVPVVSKSVEEAAEQFGWFSTFTRLDAPASSKLTQERLGWQPTGIGLIQDLETSAHYFAI